MLAVFLPSERQHDFGEAIKEGRDLGVLLVVELAEAAAGEEHGDAAEDDGVVVEPRAVFEAAGEVEADVAGDLVLEDESFQRRGLVEPDVVGVVDEPKSRGDVEIDAGVEEPQAWVDEVALPLDAAGAEVGVEAL